MFWCYWWEFDSQNIQWERVVVAMKIQYLKYRWIPTFLKDSNLSVQNNSQPKYMVILLNSCLNFTFNWFGGLLYCQVTCLYCDYENKDINFPLSFCVTHIIRFEPNTGRLVNWTVLGYRIQTSSKNSSLSSNFILIIRNM